MNFSRAILLFNTNIRVIATAYDLEDEKPNDLQRSKRKLHKTLDPAVKVGDLVIVPVQTRYKRSCVKVVETDIEVDDFESSGEIPWIIGILDETEFDRSKAMEAEGVEVMRSAEKRRLRDELKKSILKDNPGFADLAVARANQAMIEGNVEQPPPSFESGAPPMRPAVDDAPQV